MHLFSQHVLRNFESPIGFNGRSINGFDENWCNRFSMVSRLQVIEISPPPRLDWL